MGNDVQLILASQIVRTANATQIQMMESCDRKAPAVSGAKVALSRKECLTFEYISCATVSESSQ